MKNIYRVTGLLFIAGGIALFIPYTLLTITFDYPDILRQNPSVILTKFSQGGSNLIWTWFAFAISGIPLIPAYIFLGQRLENKSKLARLATTIGVTGLILQMIGLLRWTFVVPVLAESFISSPIESIRSAAIMNFNTLHQFAGVLLGEYLGQLFTITWTILISFIAGKSAILPKWIVWFGYIASVIYLLAQAELFATVIKNFPVWDLAGFLGSTLWLIWLIIIGVMLALKKNLN
jgi:hypothetical protein